MVTPAAENGQSLRPTVGRSVPGGRTFSDLEEENRSPKAAETVKRNARGGERLAAGQAVRVVDRANHAARRLHPG
jgi:hypothetical protein